eukprot:g12842.t1
MIMMQLQFESLQYRGSRFSCLSMASLVPNARSLHVLQAFYVFAEKDAPGKLQPSSKAFVLFHELRRSQSALELEHYKGVQLTLITYRDFLKHEDKLKYVRLPVGTSKPATALSIDVLSPSLQPPVDIRRNITQSGVYLLIFSNCGAEEKIKIAGRVVVRNPFGYLPGVDYYKWPLYGYLALLYLVLLGYDHNLFCVIRKYIDTGYWVLRSCMYRKQLFAIHRCIGFVILIGLLECGLCQVLVLLASLGWGITQPTLPRNTIFKIQLLTFLYLILDSVREVVLSVRHSLVLPLSFVLLCLIPIAFLHGGILYWIFVALSSLLTELERSRQTAKLDLYLKFWKVLVLSVVILGVSFLYQLYTYSTSIERQLEKQKWSQLWIFTDLVGHALFLLVLVTMMHLWAPSARSHQIAYSHQLAEGDELAVAVGV